MGQKNKLCSSNKVDVDNIVFSALQYDLRTLEDNLEHTYTAEDGMEKCVEGRGGTKLSP